MSQFCSNCGEKTENGKFCPSCGMPMDDMGKRPAAQENVSRTATPSGEIILGPDGVYRWAYDLNLFTNPTILFLLWKIFAFVTLGLFVFVTLISMSSSHFWFAGFFALAKGFGIFLIGIMALVLVGYLFYAIIQGGKYCVLFEMDEKGVTHTQAPKQFKKAQITAAITAFTATKAGTMGTAILSGSKSSSSSNWKFVKRISCHPGTRVIKVNEPLSKNQVYASKEDYEFVRNYIISHCPEAKIKG